MDDDLARTSVRLPASLLKRLAEFRFANQIETKTEALIRALELGLEAASPEKEAAE